MKYRSITLIFLACFSLHIAYADTGINQKAILKHTPGISSSALNYAIKGYEWAKSHGDVKNSSILTIVNFSKPSYEKRVWVIDLKSDKPLMNLYIAQGKNSGLIYARRFSNKPGTDESSLGVYETLNAYYGEHGLSMRIDGLEAGVNSNAFRRDIVVHPAWYVTSAFIRRYHRAGRSWGCFALNPKASKKFIDLTKGGSVIFAYAKQERSDPNLESVV